MSETEKIVDGIDLIFAELRKAKVKFPAWPDEPVHGAAILSEESGELVQAALDYYYWRAETVVRMRKEGAQVGATALRVLYALNPENNIKRFEEDRHE